MPTKKMNFLIVARRLWTRRRRPLSLRVRYIADDCVERRPRRELLDGRAPIDQRDYQVPAGHESLDDAAQAPPGAVAQGCAASGNPVPPASTT